MLAAVLRDRKRIVVRVQESPERKIAARMASAKWLSTADTKHRTHSDCRPTIARDKPLHRRTKIIWRSRECVIAETNPCRSPPRPDSQAATNTTTHPENPTCYAASYAFPKPFENITAARDKRGIGTIKTRKNCDQSYNGRKVNGQFNDPQIVPRVA